MWSFVREKGAVTKKVPFLLTLNIRREARQPTGHVLTIARVWLSEALVKARLLLKDDVAAHPYDEGERPQPDPRRSKGDGLSEKQSVDTCDHRVTAVTVRPHYDHLGRGVPGGERAMVLGEEARGKEQEPEARQGEERPQEQRGEARVSPGSCGDRDAQRDEPGDGDWQDKATLQ